MDAPPSRYRVVERGGRLVVIDSAVGGAPLTARDLLPDMASDDEANVLPLERYPRESGDPGPQEIPPMTLDSRLRGNTAQEDVAPIPSPRPTSYEAPGAAQSVAETVTGNNRDDQGRLLLTTARWYDAKAPRTLRLSEAGERQLGGVVIALLVGVVVAIFFAIMGDVVGWVMVVAAVVLASRAKPVATAWLDRLTDV